MKISVKAKPRAREERVEQLEDGSFVISVKESPIQGKANIAILKALATYFKISPSEVRLVSGFSSRQKVFEISE